MPALETNQTYTITYKVLSDPLKNNETNQIQNLVEAQNGNQTINVYGPVITFTRNILEKTGKRNNDGTITWTIQLNQDKENLKGYTLKDQFNQEEKIIQAKIEPALDGQDTITLPHTFEQNNTNTYTITYTTDPEVLINNQQTLNKAILEKGVETIEQETSVYIEEAHTYKPLKKQGNKITLTKDNNYETEWTLTINLDQGSLAKNWTITDQLEGGSNTHYTNQQKEALIKEIQTKFNTTNNQPTTNGFTSEQLTFEWTDIDERGQTKSFKITGKQPLPKGTKIDIKYTNITQVENEATLSNKDKITDRHQEQKSDPRFFGQPLIPTLELPVLSTYSQEAMDQYPCLYASDEDHLVICAHNADSHFGRIQQLGFGDPITIQTTTSSYQYKIEKVEILEPSEVERMIDLSLIHI